MDIKLKDYVNQKFWEYKKEVSDAFAMDTFLNDVLQSFVSAAMKNHYVVLIPMNYTEYFSEDEHEQFKSKGYLQIPEPARFNNKFIIPFEKIEDIKYQLKEEDMEMEVCKLNNLSTLVVVVTLNGVSETEFFNDIKTE